MIKINKFLVTSIIFILIIFYFGINILLNNFVEMKNVVFESIPIKEKIAKIDDIFRKLPNEEEILAIYSLEQNAINSHFYADAQYGYIIKDYQGKLHFPYTKVDVSNVAENTINLAKKLETLGVPLIYVQAPSKKLKGYTKMPIGDYNDFSNECADEFLNKIEDDVKTLDLREKIILEDIDRDSIFYKTDHHWTTEAAFWAATKIVTYLNENINANIDTKYFDIKNYNVNTYRKSFLGSIGRRVGEFVTGVDDYTIIYPKFDASYEIFYPVISESSPFRVGNFYEAILREHIFTDPKKAINKHASYFEYDYGNLIIKNNNIKNGTKLLLIKDSFSLPTAAFLSTGVEELHMVDVRYEGAPSSITQYVDGNDFDAVIILYNTQVFSKTMFNFE